MNKKFMIYGILVLAIAAVALTIAICRPKPAGLATGTPAELSQGKSSSASVEDNIKANWGRGGQWTEDAG